MDRGHRLARRQSDDLSTLVSEKRIAAEDERASSELDKRPEGCVNLPCGARSQDMRLQSERMRGILQASRYWVGNEVGRIDQQSYDD